MNGLIKKPIMNPKRKSVDIFRPFSFFVFVCFGPLFSFFSPLIGTSLAHLILILLAYIPFLSLFILRAEKVDNYILFSFFLITLFCIYSIFTIHHLYIFEDYALPSAVSFFSGIIGFYFLMLQKDVDSTEIVLKISTIVFAVYYLFFYSPNESLTYMYGYDMFSGYRALFPCLLAIGFTFTVKKIRFIERIVWGIIAISLLLFMLAYGSRGPLLGIVFFSLFSFVHMLLNRRMMKGYQKLLLIITIIIVLSLFVVLSESIFQSIDSFFSSKGISSRTISRILGGTLSWDNGRSSIASEALRNLNYLGHGPFSDQFFFGEGNYCHNFFIEVLFDFGIVFGSILIIFTLYVLVSVFIKYNDSKWFWLFNVLLSFCSGRLLISGSFWTETLFWMLVAVTIKILKQTVDS